MKWIWCCAIGSVLTLGFSACALPGLAPVEHRYFQLNDSSASESDKASAAQTSGVQTSGAENSSAMKSCPRALSLRSMQSNSFLGSQKIVFGSNPEERGYYQFASWIEPPPDRLIFLLERAFDRSDSFRSVTTLSTGASADLELDTTLVDFSHDTSVKPGKTRIEIRAQLIELGHRSVVADKTFVQEEPVDEFTAAGAVTALTKGSNAVIDSIVAWTGRVCRQLPAPVRSATATRSVEPSVTSTKEEFNTSE